MMTFRGLRRTRGSIAAEYAAALMILFLAITFPLINMATCTYRYNMLVAAVHNAAHGASTAPTFSNTSTGVAAIVPGTVHKLLDVASGIKINSIQFRINQSNVATQSVVHYAWGQKLSSPANPANIYSIEATVNATVSPLVPLSGGGFIPPIPGLTGPATYSVSSQELVETIAGLNS